MIKDWTLRTGRRLLAAAGAVSVALALVLSVFIAGQLAVSPGWAQSSASGAKEISSLKDLPNIPDSGKYLISWDGMQGLTARPLAVSPVSVMPPLTLTAAPVPGRHRIGVRINSVKSGRVSRTSIWLRSTTPAQLLIEVRDQKEVHSGKAVVKLPENMVVRSDGDISKPVFKTASDGWTQLDIDMTFGDAGDTNDTFDYVYITFVGDKDSLDFTGNGQSVDFGGVALATMN